VVILQRMDHAISALTPCTLAQISRATVDDLTTGHPRLARALWWATLVDEAVLREWLASMGRRPSEVQLAHLLCELRVRLHVAGAGQKNRFWFPLTQQQLGDVLGITTVNINRMMQQLREKGLVILHDKTVTIPDIARLENFAGFDPEYLHLREPSSAPRPSQREF
jgi:CRP-like cAMP-binding protein